MSVDRGTENRRRRPTNSNSLACQWASPSKVDFLMKIAISDASLVYICVLDGATAAFLISSKSGSSSSTLRHWNLKVHKTFSQQLLQCPGRCQMTRRAAEKPQIFGTWTRNHPNLRLAYSYYLPLASHTFVLPLSTDLVRRRWIERKKGEREGQTSYYNIIYNI